MTPFEQGYHDEKTNVGNPITTQWCDEYREGRLAAIQDRTHEYNSTITSGCSDCSEGEDPNEVSLWEFMLYLSLIGASVMLSLTFICWLISKVWRHWHP